MQTAPQPASGLPSASSPGAARSEPTDSSPADPATARHRRPRLQGVDVARGIALLGMIAVHVFDDLDDAGEPTLATQLAAGRASTLFVFLAGVGLALFSGGADASRAGPRPGLSVSVAVRALLIGALGLWLGELATGSDVDIILPCYGVLFLLAVPLLRMPTGPLVALAVGLVVVAPVVVLWTVDAVGSADLGSDGNPTFGTLVDDPGHLLAGLFVTGEYPVVAFAAYLAVGIVVGRLRLGSGRVAAALVGVGLAVVVASRSVSWLLLFRAGGISRLIDADGDGSARTEVNRLLWSPEEPVGSWWYLAVPAPHTTTPVDLLHTLGCAAAVLGAALLVCRGRAARRLLAPVAAAGSMTLTLYSAHLFVLAADVIEEPLALYLGLVVAALVGATWWRRRFGQGPLERLVGVLSGRAAGLAGRVARR